LAREAALDHSTPKNRTLMPLYCRSVEAFFGIASNAFAAAVPQG
jgi:hypothetical protein